MTRIVHSRARPLDWASIPAPDPDAPLGPRAASGDGPTTFRLYAPRATAAVLCLYDSPQGGRARRRKMRLGADGVWSVEAKGAGPGTWYEFRVDGPTGAAERFDGTVPLSDPYARANAGSRGRSLVVDESFDWGPTLDFRPPAQSDAVVYEAHVKDLTQHPSSGVRDSARRGKYLGLASARVINHLKQLGVNTLELLPVHEFDDDTAPAGRTNHWGYMTSHYFAPEGRYATSRTDGSAVRELKTAVRELHRNGIAVVLDVVFNHTAEGNEDGPVYNLKGLDNRIFYRLRPDGTYWNGTGCGNEVASERPAVRKLIVDSCRYWREQYRVDGFRFDLGAGLDRETMLAVREALGPGALLFCEPWTADWSRRRWEKGALRGSGWGLWNDGFRESVKALIEGRANRSDLMSAVSGGGNWFAAAAAESLNYVESHDDRTLADFAGRSRAKHHLATVALLTSAGVPMLHQGQEFRKHKQGHHNTYDQDNELNWIDWRMKGRNRETFELHRGLIALRRARPELRPQKPRPEDAVEWLLPENPQALGYVLDGEAGAPDLMVLLNGDPERAVGFELPGRRGWQVLCDGDRVEPAGLGEHKRRCRVPPSTGMVLQER